MKKTIGWVASARFQRNPFGRSLAIEPLEDRRLLSVGLTPTATLTGLNNPRALAFDSSGNLYVANEAGTAR